MPPPLALVTAVMLGLVSLVTALGAWQSASWSSQASALFQDAADARDVSINQSVLAEFTRRADRQALAEARQYYEDYIATDDFDEGLYLAFTVQAKLATATPGLSEAWLVWAGEGFPAGSDPLEDPTYRVTRDGNHTSYLEVSVALGEVGSMLEAKSAVLAQAALVQALSLFLLGLSGTLRVERVRGGVVVLGILVFLAGLGLAAAAF